MDKSSVTHFLLIQPQPMPLDPLSVSVSSRNSIGLRPNLDTPQMSVNSPFDRSIDQLFLSSSTHSPEHWEHLTQLSMDMVDEQDQRIKEDVIRMIVQYLADEGYSVSRTTLLDEANVKWNERKEKAADIKKLRKVILEGDWPEVDKICAKPILKNQRLFIYAAYKQQYLEYIEHHEIQKAFAHLNKRLKPLEHLQTNPNEFRDLCYLLTARSVHEAPSFKNWEGIMAGREQLIEHFQSLYEFETLNAQTSQYVPNHRLMTLLRQAIAYQVHSSRHIPKVPPKINTLLEDYTAFLVPNVKKTIFKGHAANVKCVDFVGEMGHSIVSGSSDHLGIVWNIQTGEIESHLEGHTSRIWDVASNKVGDLIATGSADRTVKLWSFSSGWSNACTFSEHEGDVYSVKFHPGQRHLLTGGYDRTLRLFDIEKQTLVKSFSGHGLSISKCVFTPLGNLIVSGSKDSTIRFWDLVSGLCVRTISSHLGEVTSVEMSQNGLLLLSSSKDNSNRLWDVRMLRPIKRYKGHQNTSRNFIRSSFAGNSLVLGGSEDGIVYIWDSEKANIVQKLRGHAGMTYQAIYNQRQSLVVSCSDDHTLMSWTVQ